MPHPTEQAADTFAETMKLWGKVKQAHADMLAFVKDMAENGGRFDTNPTMNFATDARGMAQQYNAYLARLDKGLREGAQRVLGRIAAETAK